MSSELPEDRQSYPFDHYQRFEPLRTILEALRVERGGGSLCVADVGGANGALRQFLPADRITVLDLSPRGTPDVLARGEALPLRDASVDVAVCIDTLEHVPCDLRERLLGEATRIARDLVVVAAPFDEPGVRAAEVYVELCHVKLYGESDSWLLEHEARGLPSLPQCVEVLGRAFPVTRVVPNGYLPFWRWTMALNYMLLSMPESFLLYQRLNRQVNQGYYDHSHREPSYRKLVVAARRGGSWLDEALDRMTRPSRGSTVGIDALEAETLAIVRAGVGDFFDEKLKIIRMLEDHVHELQGFVEGLRGQIQGLHGQIWELKAELDKAKRFTEHLGREHDVLSAEYAHAKEHVVELEAYVRRMEGEFAGVDKLLNEFGVEKELLRIRNLELESQAKAAAQQIKEKDMIIRELQGRVGFAGLRRLLSPGGSGGAGS